MIYHIVLEPDFRASLDGSVYEPASLAHDGFIHCAEEPSVLPVANDYYSDTEAPLLLVEIDPGRLTVEVRYEDAAPIAGGGSSHLASAARFPHVYGPIGLEAITRIGELSRSPAGFQWPQEFATPDRFR